MADIESTYGAGMGLLNGINQGLAAYQEARNKQNDKDVQLAGLGLKQVVDQNGNRQIIQDPALAAQKRVQAQNEIKQKAAIEGWSPTFDPQTGALTNDPKDIQAQILANKAKTQSVVDPYGNAIKKTDYDAKKTQAQKDQLAETQREGAVKTGSDALAELASQPTTGFAGAWQGVKNLFGQNPALDQVKASIAGVSPDKAGTVNDGLLSKWQSPASIQANIGSVAQNTGLINPNSKVASATAKAAPHPAAGKIVNYGNKKYNVDANGNMTPVTSVAGQ